MNPLSLISRLMPRDMQQLPLPNGVGELKPIPLTELEGIQGAKGIQSGQGVKFENVLGSLVGDVNAKQLESASAMRGMMSGGDVSLHQAVIAMEEASVSFQLMVEVRNKLLESYQELMRMQM
jgi:flagellar hook-basal body complex protein FliE